MERLCSSTSKIISTLNLNRSTILNKAIVRCLSDDHSSDQDVRTQHLKASFNSFDRPNYYDKIVADHPNISKLKQASVLIPLTTKFEKNAKRNNIINSDTYC